MEIFKYRSAGTIISERDQKSILENSFWFSKLEHLNDPMEGTIDYQSIKLEAQSMIRKKKKTNDPFVQSLYDTLNSALDSFIDRRTKVGIYSLSKSYNEKLMWAHYANEHRGYCLGFDYNKLPINHNDNNVYNIPVVYSDRPPKITVDDMNKLKKDNGHSVIKKLLCYKSTDWSYEKEVRLIVDFPGLVSFPESSISSLYLGANISSNARDQLLNLFENSIISIYQMNIDENYNLIAKEL